MSCLRWIIIYLFISIFQSEIQSMWWIYATSSDRKNFVKEIIESYVASVCIVCTIFYWNPDVHGFWMKMWRFAIICSCYADIALDFVFLFSISQFEILSIWWNFAISLDRVFRNRWSNNEWDFCVVLQSYWLIS